MKILSLNLTAFGPFTDLSLDLSQGSEGLHIIYGPNEAGKSSALRALIAFFYGIPPQSSDNFIHDNRKLKIGMHLKHSEGTQSMLYRRKGTKRTLLDTDNEPLDESVLSHFTSGMSEELFTMMFAIDHRSLIRGGKNILKGGGAVGESLFAASMGGLQIRQVITELEQEAAELFIPRGSNQKIPQALNHYKKALNECRDFTLLGQQWTELDRSLRQSLEDKQKIDHELGELEKEENRLRRFNRALPKISGYQELSSELSEMGDVKILAPEFGEHRQDACNKLINAEENLERAKETLSLINQKISTLTVPEQLLKHREAIIEIHKQLGSNRKAFKDLSRLEIEKRQLENEAEAIIKDLRPDLSLNDAYILRLGRQKRTQIQELGNKYQALITNFTRWSEDVDNLHHKLDITKEQLQKLDCLKEPSKLKSAVSRTQKLGDLEDELKNRISELDSEKERAELNLKKLRLWSGSLEDLEALSIPQSETIDRFGTYFDEIKQKRQILEDRKKETEERKSGIERYVQQINLSGSVPLEDDLIKARAHRDKGWHLVRRSWLEGENVTEEAQAFAHEISLDAAYEKSVKEADDIADRLRREADRVAKQAELLAQAQKCDNDIVGLQKELTRVDERHRELTRSWEDLWQPGGISPLTPQEMRSWILHYNAVVQQAEQIRLNKQRIVLIRTRIEEHQGILSACLEELGEPVPGHEESLAALIDRCEHVVETYEEKIRQRKELEKDIHQLESDLVQALRKKEHSETELKKWQTQWISSVQELGLSEHARPSHANAVLSRVEELFHILDKIRNLEARIKGIQRDGVQFEKDTCELVETAAPDLTNVPPHQAASELNDRLSKALGDSRELQALKEQKKEKEKIIHQSSTTRKNSNARLRDLCGEAGCTEVEELEEMERRSHKARDIQKEMESLKKQIHEESAGASFDSFIKEAQEMDQDALPSQINTLSETIKELKNKQMELQETIGKQKNQIQSMKGGSDAAEAAEKSQEYLATVQTDVNRYVRLRLASAILRREIERYRKENQAPLLKRAGEIFSHLTQGSFSSLQTDYNEKDEPVIIGLRPSGESVTVSGMSDGTRDQLYLSLRIAGLEKYLRTNEPMPLIVDDILINFDNQRSQATLTALAEMSHKTQVIFFTHHKHLVHLAQETVPNDVVKIHTLEL
jgi:uncharacterized protein YhaN